MNRREFISMAGAGVALAGSSLGAEGRVRIGVIGTGHRGTSLTRLLTLFEEVEIPVLCDINPEHLANGQKVVTDSGRRKPEGYSRSEVDYKRMLERGDLDGVLIATPWEWHVRMATDSMNAKIYTGCEVPIANTIDECWQIINTQEETKTPCMMLENWSFRRDNLAVLNMVRKGMFGDITYAQGAYAHECNGEWFFNPDGTNTWVGDHLMNRNADQYPTHGMGPILSWLDINCGDYPEYLTSTATRAIAVNRYFERRYGTNHPTAKRKVMQGDIVTTVIKTIKGRTIMVYNDMVSPRPYDNKWQLSGSNGIYSHEHDALYIEGVSPLPHSNEAWEPFEPYQEKYDHTWHREIQETAGKLKTDVVSHGAPDYLEVKFFVEAVRDNGPLPLDIYDSVVMSAPVGLSDISISKGSAPVPFPDFTRGAWRTRKPYFALEQS
ncbi:MAG TPA: Gfo/Idh/MocA family oxidoreductase [Terriglobia bacterium]|nr:Gfo/Idh/MocA family oxidoreductase [Terriglobia bacterium]